MSKNKTNRLAGGHTSAATLATKRDLQEIEHFARAILLVSQNEIADDDREAAVETFAQSIRRRVAQTSGRLAREPRA